MYKCHAGINHFISFLFCCHVHLWDLYELVCTSRVFFFTYNVDANARNLGRFLLITVKCSFTSHLLH